MFSQRFDYLITKFKDVNDFLESLTSDNFDKILLILFHSFSPFNGCFVILHLRKLSVSFQRFLFMIVGFSFSTGLSTTGSGLTWLLDIDGTLVLTFTLTTCVRHNERAYLLHVRRYLLESVCTYVLTTYISKRIRM